MELNPKEHDEDDLEEALLEQKRNQSKYGNQRTRSEDDDDSDN